MDDIDKIVELEKRYSKLRKQFAELRQEIADELDLIEVEHFLHYGAEGKDPESKL